MAAKRKTTGTIGSPQISRRILRRRGFSAIAIRERGTIGRGRKAEYRKASAGAWYDTAMHFHTDLRDRRFDPAHQRAAGFALRKGQGMPRGTKAFMRSYTGTKLAKYGHERALEFSGETRRKIRQVSLSSTSNKGKAAYRGASKFSFRHPKSRIRMMDEFRRLLPNEVTELAEVYDASLDSRWQ